MDPAKTPLFANLDRALRKAYDRPEDDAGRADLSDSAEAGGEWTAPERIGRYRVRGVIARGGMGAVLRAEDAELGRDVAVKVSRSRDPALLELFANEARICSQLQHPGIVPVYERGRTEDARPYYVMKLIEGETLATLLGARPSPATDAGRMLDVFMAVCQTMAYVHARGFFHGDLKPGNIMVGAFGEVQVMDWGIAGGGADPAAAKERGEKLPLAVGTPAYMPPERARADRDLIGIRSDVFSLGAILCEVLTGDPPYRGSHRSEIFRKAVNAELEATFALLDASGADSALVGLAKDCLAVGPQDRPADAEAVAHRIGDHLNAVGQRARDAEIELARAHAKHLSERRARRLTLALAAALILGLVGGGTGFLLLREEKRTRQAEAARLVDEALVEAHEGLAEAKVTQPPDPERWATAEAAAVRAVALAERSAVDPATLARARALQSEAHTLRSNRLRHLAFQERIDEIEHHGLEEDRQPDWLDAAYRDAFRENGIDPAHIDAELLSGEDERASLSLALARWALARRRTTRDPASSKELLAAAMVVDPDPGRKELCSAFLSGNHEELLRKSRAHESLGASPESLFLLSRFLLDLNHPEESTAVLRSACARFPGDFRVHHDLAARLGVEPKPPFDEIIRLLSMCVAIRPSSAHALIDLGTAYHRHERLELAAAALQKATALQPSHARGWIGLAIAMRDMGAPDAAREAANTAIRCESDAENLVRMTSLWNRGLSDVAETSLRKALEIMPGHARARMELGRLEAARGAYEDAIGHLREGLAIAPKTAAAWYALGGALAATMNLEDARDAVEKAIDLGERSDGAALEFARLLLLEGNTDRAIEALEVAHERNEAKADEADPATRGLIALARRAADLPSPADAVREAAAESRTEAGSGTLAQAAFLRGWFRTSASLFLSELRRDPAAGASWRMPAARAASLAGRGLGHEATDDARRPALRAQALGWLREEIDGLRTQWTDDHLEGPRVRRALKALKSDGAFPSERRRDFGSLPAAEQQSWTDLWRDVERLLADLDALVVPPGTTALQTFTAKALGIPGPLAGIQFAGDGATLYVVGSAGFEASCIYALPVLRDSATRTITGFGPARLHSPSAHADGGLSQAADGTFYWSTWREHELGQLPLRGTVKQFPLSASGVPAGGGGLAFVPGGAQAGTLLMSGYTDGGLYGVELSEPIGGARTPVPGSARLVARLPRGIEGIRYAPPSSRLAGSLLVCNWDAGAVSLVDVDGRTGLPAADEKRSAATRNFLSGIEGASGLDFDPVTGDLLVTSWGSGNRIRQFSGLKSR